jgi:NADH dehydrogenase FAD-containing subunit
LVWSTGLAPNPLVESITELKKDWKTTTLITDNHLNVLKNDGIPDPDVWAIGDAAMIDGTPLPATAQGKIVFSSVLQRRF